MKKQTSLITLSLLLATPALAGGSGAPAAQPATNTACRTIAQILSGDAQFSTLLTAVQAAGLAESLTTGEYTVFAPTNAAFAKVPSDQLAALLNDAEMLSSVLLYHIVTEQVSGKQVASLKSLKTVQGSNLTVGLSGSRVQVDGANVTRADIAACNGVIHVIDTVLMPTMAEAETAEPAAETTTETEVAEASTETTDEATTETVETTETATTTETTETTETTVAAAPAATAFDITQIPALPLSGATTTETTTEATTETTESTEVATTETTTETAVTTEATTETTAEVETATTEATTTEATETATAEVTTTETTTTETATETTTEVTAESNTLFDVIVADERFSTLRDLLSDAGLEDMLVSGDYTIFAPTNEAFDALPAGTLETLSANPELLRQVLSYHVVQGRVTETQLSTGTSLTSAQGGTLTLSSGGSVISEAKIALTSAITTASNGNIFPIDRVLIPAGLTLPAATDTATDTAATVTTPAGTLVALITTDPRFSTLAQLVQQAGLTETLASGEYTVFAPTNEAFAKVAAADLTALSADPARLKEVLLYHVVPTRVTETALASSNELTNAGNAKLTLQRMADPARIMVGDATLTAATPTEAGNGLVYSIDTVLMPPR